MLVRKATLNDVAEVRSVLLEAAHWLHACGKPLWFEDELLASIIEGHASEGLYFLGEINGETAGTFRLQPSDPEIWPDVPEGESLFLHKLAIRRRFAGAGVSGSMLEWATDYARGQGLAFLRLDCEAGRPSLREFYARNGFASRDDITVPHFRNPNETIMLARFERALR